MIASQSITNCRAEQSQNTEADDEMSSLVTSQGLPSQVSESQKTKPEIFVMFEGFWLIARSPYLMYISLFLWLSAVVSSFFYFQVWFFYICLLTWISSTSLWPCCFLSYIVGRIHHLPSIWILPDFQKVTIVATTISSPTARRRTFALINSFIAVFILAGQLTLTVFIHLQIVLGFIINSTPFCSMNKS